MESNKPNNPNAFPMYNELGNLNDEGMTLRDYFAAKAMQAYLSNKEIFISVGNIAKNKGVDLDIYVAETAYEQADAMLKQREL